MSEKNKALIRAFVEAINAEDWSRLRSLVDDCSTRHSIAAGEPGVQSVEDFLAFLQGEFLTFPDAHETLLDLVAEGQGCRPASVPRHAARPNGSVCRIRQGTPRKLPGHLSHRERAHRRGMGRVGQSCRPRQLGHHLDEYHAAAADEERGLIGPIRKLENAARG